MPVKLSLAGMNRLMTQSAMLIVAAGMSMGSAFANLKLDDAPITQHTCDQRYDLTPDGKIVRHNPLPNDRVIEPGILLTDDWPKGLITLLDELNELEFDEGNLNVIDCVGTRTTARVRSRHYELDNLNRQGNEERGWRFSAEANLREEGILRLLRLELPPNYEWEVNEAGDGLIASQPLFHQLNFRINEVPTEFGVNSSAPDSVFPEQLRQDGIRYNRVRITEVKQVGESLQFMQLITTNESFDVLSTWTLN